MGIKRKMTKTADRPRGFYGLLMMQKMNYFHTKLHYWGLGLLETEAIDVLEIGVGGGKNLKRIARRFPKAKLYGVDLSPLAIWRAKAENLFGVLSGNVKLNEANVSALPYAREAFDKVLAFETIYYWKALKEDFQEVYRVLKEGGEFLICNEDYKKPQVPNEHDYLREILPINIYTNDEVIAALKEAGFKKIVMHLHKNGDWVSFVAHK